jgi:hypothetical protein
MVRVIAHSSIFFFQLYYILDFNHQAELLMIKHGIFDL